MVQWPLIQSKCMRTVCTTSNYYEQKRNIQSWWWRYNSYNSKKTILVDVIRNSTKGMPQVFMFSVHLCQILGVTQRIHVLKFTLHFLFLLFSFWFTLFFNYPLIDIKLLQYAFFRVQYIRFMFRNQHKLLITFTQQKRKRSFKMYRIFYEILSAIRNSSMAMAVLMIIIKYVLWSNSWLTWAFCRDDLHSTVQLKWSYKHGGWKFT